MDKNKRKQRNRNIFKVAMILYTQGLEYDDRIRKEILSLQKGIPNLEFTIFAVVPENKEKFGTTDYGIPYYIPHLKTRDKYKSGSKTLYKAYDFYRAVKPRLKDFDLIWCADVETFFFPLLLNSKRKIIWDQHEIPTPFISNYVMKRVFRYLENKCDIMYHANQPRIDYLLENRVIVQPDKHISIRNYPENLETSIANPDSKFNEFKKWLGDRKCVYIQGVSGKDRKAYETVSAVLKESGLTGVVVGTFDSDALSRLEKEYGPVLKERIYFTGKVPQVMTKLYIKESMISLVFYAMDEPNNIYCEPNRLFQSLMMGIPVIVGENPSMRDVVEPMKVGVVLNNDGSDINSIRNALKEVLGKYEYYKKNVLSNRNKLCWDNQEALLVRTFKSVISHIKK